MTLMRTVRGMPISHLLAKQFRVILGGHCEEVDVWWLMRRWPLVLMTRHIGERYRGEIKDDSPSYCLSQFLINHKLLRFDWSFDLGTGAPAFACKDPMAAPAFVSANFGNPNRGGCILILTFSPARLSIPYKTRLSSLFQRRWTLCKHVYDL